MVFIAARNHHLHTIQAYRLYLHSNRLYSAAGSLATVQEGQYRHPRVVKKVKYSNHLTIKE